jgi:hypothetical protein
MASLFRMVVNMEDFKANLLSFVLVSFIESVPDSTNDAIKVAPKSQSSDRAQIGEF